MFYNMSTLLRLTSGFMERKNFNNRVAYDIIARDSRVLAHVTQVTTVASALLHVVSNP